MNLLFFSSIVSLTLLVLLNLVSFLISEKSSLNREDLSSYECGFEHHSLSRVPFSLRYFLLTLVFLLFDLEIVLIIFVPVMLFSSTYFFSLLALILFLVILFFSLIYEWSDGSLEWVA